MRTFLACLALSLTLAMSHAAEISAAPVSTEAIVAATQAWADAFNSRETDRVVGLYAEDAVFWGTTSPIIRDTPALVREYFGSMPDKPLVRVAITEQHPRIFGDVAINSGAYTFSNVVDGRPTASLARFTFTYQRRDGRWMIVDHHSSALPPPATR